MIRRLDASDIPNHQDRSDSLPVKSPLDHVEQRDTSSDEGKARPGYRSKAGNLQEYPVLKTNSYPDTDGKDLRPISNISKTESVTNYHEQLKNTLLGNTIVHEQTIPPQRQLLVKQIDHLGAEVTRVVQAAGIEYLYSHQELALHHIGNGRNVVISTPTASGKTLIYNAAVLASLLKNPQGHALYVFPLKALEQDQYDELKSLIYALGGEIRAEVYDGDTKPHRRQNIKKNPPHILITTPDMLHSGILAFHEQWESFFRDLQFIVLDELHTYSGIFGSHILHLIRRLNRICTSCGSTPQYITCSATIGNPAEFAHKIFNREFTAITKSGAPTAKKYFLFLNPPESPNTVAARLLQTSVSQGFRSIAFTRARVVTELIYQWATQAHPELRDRISSYRAGYMPEERRQIEARLISGDLLGVVSTSALELGIDIGGLDICILVGYPGSIVNTWQRAGRVGRSGRESLVILIASRDALDQFFMAHPQHFFQRQIENAVVDPSNRYILKEHLACAAHEVPLTADDPEYAIKGYEQALEELTAGGILLQNAEGNAWFASRKQPHRSVHLRSIGESWTIVNSRIGDNKTIIGSINGNQLYNECYAGAIYLHRGAQYLIGDHNPIKRQIDAQAIDVPYYTRPKCEKETEIIEEQRSKPMHNYMAKLGRLIVSSQVTAYEKIRVGDQTILSRHPLESPVQRFETVGFWIEMDAIFKKQLKRHGFHHMGSLHAIEHAVKSLFPLLALSKQTDVGGICYPLHPQFRKGAIFIYDQYPGGIGLAETGYDLLEQLFVRTLEMVVDCDCIDGCPACIHFPTCGAGNHPLDKLGCIHLLEILTGHAALDDESFETNEINDEPPLYANWESSEDCEPEGQQVERKNDPHVVIFDLETQLSAAEVGGWDKAELMRISCGIAWCSLEDRFITYYEHQIDDLIRLLQKADLVVGFNILGFDYKVLRGYSNYDFRHLNTLDILRDVHSHLNYRVSLHSLATATLDAEKSADGLQALRWWKEGRLDLIEKYCRHDVELTRDLFRHGLENGFLLFDRKDNGHMRVPVAWTDRLEAAKEFSKIGKNS
tara:strand:+ start:2137 stop:5328 length:3192 start_codon:yes stop_codon:yes gene_type:complete